MNAKQKELQEKLAHAARKANEALGDLPAEQREKIADHHNALIAHAQEAIDELGPKTKKGKKGK
jgi:acyl-CoA reductase-like NAD-dependent aldehyde dehydrogenase